MKRFLSALMAGIIISCFCMGTIAFASPSPQFTNVNQMIQYYNDLELDNTTRSKVNEKIAAFINSDVFQEHYQSNPSAALNNLKLSIDRILYPKIRPSGYESNVYYSHPAVQVITQARSNWCGVACAAMVLRQQGINQTQQAIYNVMNFPDNEGAYVYQITDAINKFKSNSYTYDYISLNQLSSYMCNSLYEDKPVILQVYNRAFYDSVLGTAHGTQYYSSSDKHYITVDSVDTLSGNVRVRDSNANSKNGIKHGGTHTISLNALKNCLSTQYIIAGA